MHQATSGYRAWPATSGHTHSHTLTHTHTHLHITHTHTGAKAANV